MRERRAAHVRPRPPSSDRLPTRPVRSEAPPADILRRYSRIRTGPKVSGPTAMVILAACIVLSLLTVTVGFRLVGDLVGGVVGAFDNSISRLISQAPATAAPSGVALDTPVIDTPANGGYTIQLSVPVQGNVPAAVVGMSGYKVNIYLVVKGGVQRKVASISVGGTTRFISPPVTLTEGSNDFVARLAGPSGEGASSPVVTMILDTTPPKLAISSPSRGAKLNASSVDVSGSSDAGATVSIRNEQAPGGSLNETTAGADGHFKLTVGLVAGTNTLDLTATDQAGNASTTGIEVTRSYGQLAAHLSAAPSKFKSSSHTTLKLTVHATSFGGAPLANAAVTFTVAIQGLGPIVSPQLTTDSKGVATWQVAITGATAGAGQASALVTSSEGDVLTATAAITTT
jgi:hypothetical protein